MLIWILRLIAVAGSPLITYYIVSPDMKGIVIGLLCGIALVIMEFMMESVSLMAIIIAIAGAIMGFTVSKFADLTIAQVDNDTLITIWKQYHVLVQFFFILLGTILAVKKVPDLDELDKDLSKISKRRSGLYKILDSSVVIDGRILDICDSHFLSGTLIAPRFMLNELHTLADSQDQMKRARGRRGLDILARLQESKEIPFKIIDRDIPDAEGVDNKIIRLAKDMGANVITTDFNMNKMAVLEGITVLNINDLSTALKPVVLPGEGMPLFIMKEGKEKEQGVGYLDDGTMVVVEEGRRWIGKRIEVTVYSILQTSAGRMIFAKAKFDHKQQQEHRDPEA